MWMGIQSLIILFHKGWKHVGTAICNCCFGSCIQRLGSKEISLVIWYTLCFVSHPLLQSLKGNNKVLWSVPRYMEPISCKWSRERKSVDPTTLCKGFLDLTFVVIHIYLYFLSSKWNFKSCLWFSTTRSTAWFVILPFSYTKSRSVVRSQFQPFIKLRIMMYGIHGNIWFLKIKW
jgi:hypothetical protein